MGTGFGPPSGAAGGLGRGPYCQWPKKRPSCSAVPRRGLASSSLPAPWRRTAWARACCFACTLPENNKHAIRDLELAADVPRFSPQVVDVGFRRLLVTRWDGGGDSCVPARKHELVVGGDLL